MFGRLKAAVERVIAALSAWADQIELHTAVLAATQDESEANHESNGRAAGGRFQAKTKAKSE